MNREKITDALKKGRILVADGAWGTALQSRGLKGGESPELWNVELDAEQRSASMRERLDRTDGNTRHSNRQCGKGG